MGKAALIGPIISGAFSLLGGGGGKSPEAPLPIPPPPAPAPPPVEKGSKPEDQVSAEQERLRGLKRRKTQAFNLFELDNGSTSNKQLLGD